MSALTGVWSVEKIRAVMVHLDRKTGLHGAELPIEMGKAVSYLGRYYCGERKSFYFSKHHLNDPAFRESEAIELIRHEYAHYYVDAAGLRPFFQDGRAHHHGPSWQYACKMVGASGRREGDAARALCVQGRGRRHQNGGRASKAVRLTWETGLFSCQTARGAL